MHWMDGFWGGGFMMFFWWLLIIIAIVALVKWAMNQRTATPKEETPMDILEKRYAGGEISKEEFEERKKDLMS